VCGSRFFPPGGKGKKKKGIEGGKMTCRITRFPFLSKKEKKGGKERLLALIPSPRQTVGKKKGLGEKGKGGGRYDPQEQFRS